MNKENCIQGPFGWDEDIKPESGCIAREGNGG